MSAAAPTADAAPPAKAGKKKLIIIVAAALLVLGGGGGGAFVYLKKKAAAEAEAAAEDGDASAGGHAARKADPAHPPTFVPLDPFVVNLADRDADKYAQIGITLEIDDAKFAEQMKAYMPAIRNGILMVLAHKSSQELLVREGKEKLAGEIMREAVRPMGIEIEADVEADKEANTQADPADDEDEDEDTKPKAKKKKKKKAAVHNPVQRVHYSNFIIQ